MTRPGALGLLAAVVALATAGPGTAAPARRSHTVVVDKLAFGPSPAGLKVGDVVVWTNKDLFDHTATAADGRFDLTLKAGGSGHVRLTKAGILRYYCRFHPGMTGELDVGR